MKRPSGTRREGGSLLWAQGLVCGGLLAARPSLAILVVLLFWPVAVAALADHAPSRPLVRSVALWSGAAGFAALRRAWDMAGFDPVWAVLHDGRTLWLVWLAAGLGWGLAQGVPLAAEAAADALRAHRAARLRAERAALLEAWRLGGNEPAA